VRRAGPPLRALRIPLAFSIGRDAWKMERSSASAAKSAAKERKSKAIESCTLCASLSLSLSLFLGRLPGERVNQEGPDGGSSR